MSVPETSGNGVRINVASNGRQILVGLEAGGLSAAIAVDVDANPQDVSELLEDLERELGHTVRSTLSNGGNQA